MRRFAALALPLPCYALPCPRQAVLCLAVAPHCQSVPSLGVSVLRLAVAMRADPCRVALCLRCAVPSHATAMRRRAQLRPSRALLRWALPCPCLAVPSRPEQCPCPAGHLRASATRAYPRCRHAPRCLALPQRIGAVPRNAAALRIRSKPLRRYAMLMQFVWLLGHASA